MKFVRLFCVDFKSTKNIKIWITNWTLSGTLERKSITSLLDVAQGLIIFFVSLFTPQMMIIILTNYYQHKAFTLLQQKSTLEAEYREWRWRSPWQQGIWWRGRECWGWTHFQDSQKSLKMIQKTAEYDRQCSVSFLECFSCRLQPKMIDIQIVQ